MPVVKQNVRLTVCGKHGGALRTEGLSAPGPRQGSSISRQLPKIALLSAYSIVLGLHPVQPDENMRYFAAVPQRRASRA